MPALRRAAAAGAVCLALGPWWAGTAAADQSGGGSSGAGALAGYGLSTVASAARMEIDSPGLLPVGDPSVGEVFEADLPFSRLNVSSGPVVDAVGSPAYPGDTAAHLGSALATFGAPALPNDPVLAEAQYPPSPSAPTKASFSPLPGRAGPALVAGGTAQAAADTSSASAQSSEGGFTIAGGPGGSPLIEVASSSTTTTAQYSGAQAKATAVTTVGSITIAGIVHIDGIRSQAASASDGQSGDPSASLRIGSVTVAGHKAYVDDSGIHIDQSGSGVGGGVGSGLADTLNRALGQDGLAVRAVAPVTGHKGGQASADSGGIVITITRSVPSLDVPAAASLTVPGAPAAPLATPGVPLKLTVALGTASARVDATVAPTFPTAGGDFSSAFPPAGTTPAGGGATTAALTSADALGSLPAGLAPTSGSASGPGSLAVAHRRPPRGVPVPFGLAVAAVVAALVLAGPLLGYARWQLLGGRR